MADTFTLYKLIILYLLDKVNFPMSNAQLSEFILEKSIPTISRFRQLCPN